MAPRLPISSRQFFQIRSLYRLDGQVFFVYGFRMNDAQSSKARILGAAATVVERSGAAHLTIDAVAAEAQLSKGGVLYHFPNKRSMLEGMVQHVLARVAERSARHRTQLSGGSNVTVRTLILAEQEQDDAERAMSLAILAAAAEDPDLLAPARAAVAGWFREISAEGGAGTGNPRLGVLLLLATEGLRFLGMLNLLPMGAAQREQIHQELLQIAQGGEP
jgi:AcrR family transcriptional regulator